MLSQPANGVMSKKEYNVLLRCVHPDGIKSRDETQLGHIDIVTNPAV